MPQKQKRNDCTQLDKHIYLLNLRNMHTNEIVPAAVVLRDDDKTKADDFHKGNKTEIAQTQFESQKKPDGPSDIRRALFCDTANGIYLTFTVEEIKTSMYRGILRVLFVALTILLFVLFWDWCDVCILATTLASCAAPCIGLSFLQPMCTAGVVACLWKGFTVASSIAEVHVQWKI